MMRKGFIGLAATSMLGFSLLSSASLVVNADDLAVVDSNGIQLSNIDSFTLDLNSQQQLFMNKLTHIYPYFYFNHNQLALSIDYDTLKTEYGFTDDDIVTIDSMLKAPAISWDNETSNIQSRMYVKGSKVYFTHADVVSALYSAALIGPSAIYAAIVGLGTISLGPVGTTIAGAVGILGFPSLAGFTYQVIQAASNGQGVYLGVEMNGIFPNIVSGTF
ncbi:hypothetical protein M4I17_02780 [Enterococcus thailandicus]|uniref:hypothetical protein n=1 Tax=Enterococcus thailandicus TaxID=417368 RepID=UPI002542ED37|nr:hypothetical protein [Enterococcus thailandicus]MDK4351332.1 hypothetical protein [Enterococcus thailandicus]MDT2732935.1 hypothetical protein [Enterococcus thailandicus]